MLPRFDDRCDGGLQRRRGELAEVSSAAVAQHLDAGRDVALLFDQVAGPRAWIDGARAHHVESVLDEIELPERTADDREVVFATRLPAAATSGYGRPPASAGEDLTDEKIAAIPLLSAQR